MNEPRQHPLRRTDRQRPDRDHDNIWPLSTREFMKRPSSELPATGRHIHWTRLSPPRPSGLSRARHLMRCPMYTKDSLLTHDEYKAAEAAFRAFR